ncbi:open rectifier potassium channel protein 1 isoform X2 [Sitodiplosis mosellana]|nr:open rectifier potassium channel protein 1 isoform X2 [Sitodiplosis mosellana]
MRYTEPQYHKEILQIVGDYCGKPVTNFTLDVHQAPLTWSFYHSFFFSFTVCSTVGYGNISPSTITGRMFMIFYALIGIPMNGFLFAYLGDFFGKVFVTAYERYKSYKMATNKNYMPHQLGLIAQIVLYLIPGMVIFLFLPALIFRYFEGWDYSEAIYYSFVTLSTIGFGDFVPTFQSQENIDNFGFMFYVYEVFIIFWFIFGLGYLVMIMSFIAKGLRSKHITRLEHQLSENIKATQSRIWNGVTKDVSYLRRILNEVYLMRFKGTDDDEPEVCSTQRRTSSCPDLTTYRPSSEPARKRAQSLFYHVDDEPDFLSNLTNMHRVQSDGDLNRKANRNRAFDESNLQLQPTELLARVFTALGNIKAADDEAQSIAAMSGGFNGLSDSQILASEKQSNWSLPFSESSYAVPPPKARGRAASDFRAPMPDQLELNNSHDWTWSGNNQQIEEFRRLRNVNKKKSPDLYRTALTSPKVENPPVVNMEEGMSPQTILPPSRASSPSIFGRFNPFKKRDDSRKMSLLPDRLDIKNYLDHTSAGRGSRISVSPFANVTPAGRRRTSTFSIMSTTDEGSADVLENTTIADLIRALEVMHTQAVTGDGPLLENLLDNPRPRLGSSISMVQSSTTQHQQQSPPPLINIFPPTTPTQQRSPRDRRNSMRPLSTANTPLSYRSNRRQSAIVDLPSTRRSSLLVPPSVGPPPYSESTPRKSHRRFSVRPTMLSIPPGQSPMPSLPSIQATSTLQRRLSRPSPLLTDYNNLNLRPNRLRSISTDSSNYSVSPLEMSPVVNRSALLAPVTETRLNVPQDRQTSRSQLFNTNTDINRRRSESK